MEKKKPEYKKETSRSRVENQETQPTYDAESGNREPGPHWWEASDLHCAISVLNIYDNSLNAHTESNHAMGY